MTDAPNVVIIILDTMRKEVLSLYGGTAKSPFLDAIASDGVVYESCVASSPWTTPSHASLFTGLLPSKHGVHETWDRKMYQIFGAMADVKAETLPSYLSERGYGTHCYSANANIAPGSGFERGFDSFALMNVVDPDEKTGQAVEMAKKHGKTRGEIAGNLLKQGKVGDLGRLFLEDRRLKGYYKKKNFPLFKGGDGIASSIQRQKLEEPFFLFVNLLEMHEPYLSGAPGVEPRPSSDLFGQRVVSGSMMEAMRRKYSEEASAVDSFVGKILGWLKESGTYDRSLVIATSDHGQALKEHGFYGHGTYMYDEILEVPLILKYPGNERPPPSPGYQPFHRVQEVVKDWLVGVKDGSSLSSDHAVAESFGIQFDLQRFSNVPDFEAKRAKYDRPRKAVYRRGLKLVVDGREGIVEELSRNGKKLETSEHKEDLKEMTNIMAALRDEGFVLPG